jgi:hypothetical protein
MKKTRDRGSTRLASVFARKRTIDQIEKMKKFANRMEERANRKRVLKPKPVRRQSERVTVVSIGPIPVDGVENGHKDIG